MDLPGVELALHLVVIFGEDLQFAHRVVGRVALARETDGEAVVAGGGHLEFQAHGEIAQLTVVVGVAALALFADDGAVDDVVVPDRAGPAGEILAVEDAGEAGLAVRGQDAVGFVAADLTDGDIAPAYGRAVGLQADRAAGGQGRLTVVVVLHDRVVHGLLAVEPDAHARAGHDDPQGVPFAGGLVGQHERVLAGVALGVVPERAGAQLGAVLVGLLIRGVPDLDLGRAAQVDARVALGGHVVFQDELEVAVFLVRRGVGAGAWVEDLAVLDGPVLGELLAHLGESRVALLAGQLGHRMRVVAVPAGKVLSVEQRGEAFGNARGGAAGVLGASADEGGCEEREGGGEGAQGHGSVGIRGARGCNGALRRRRLRTAGR